VILLQTRLLRERVRRAKQRRRARLAVAAAVAALLAKEEEGGAAAVAVAAAGNTQTAEAATRRESRRMVKAAVRVRQLQPQLQALPRYHRPVIPVPLAPLQRALGADTRLSGDRAPGVGSSSRQQKAAA
jgi:hypothetical protein